MPTMSSILHDLVGLRSPQPATCIRRAGSFRDLTASINRTHMDPSRTRDLVFANWESCAAAAVAVEVAVAVAVAAIAVAVAVAVAVQ